jgi:hypothetical protein
MSEEQLKKILFVLEMSKNKLKDDKQYLEYNKEARRYIIAALLGNSPYKDADILENKEEE